jgi:hypothetical protein
MTIPLCTVLVESLVGKDSSNRVVETGLPTAYSVQHIECILIIKN